MQRAALPDPTWPGLVDPDLAYCRPHLNMILKLIQRDPLFSTLSRICGGEWYGGPGQCDGR